MLLTGLTLAFATIPEELPILATLLVHGSSTTMETYAETVPRNLCEATYAIAPDRARSRGRACNQSRPGGLRLMPRRESSEAALSHIK
jgi:hypothetical protein